MGLLGCNHPLLLSSYRYEVIKPNQKRADRLRRIQCNNKHPWLDHPLFGTNFRQEFANNMNPVSLRPSGSSEPSPGAASGRIKLTNISPLQRTSARYDFMASRPPGGSCVDPSGGRPVMPNHDTMHTAYRYETRQTERQQPPLQTDDFRADSCNPVMRTSFRYEYVRPRPAGAVPRPVADPMQQAYICHRYGAASAP